MGCGDDSGADGGGAPGPNGNAGITRHTMQSSAVSPGSGFVLETGTVVPLSEDEENPLVDFVQLSTMVVLFYGVDLEFFPFCIQGDGFGTVAEVPADVATCEWEFKFQIAGNGSYTESQSAGVGMVLRDRNERLYRLLIVEDHIDEQGVATVAFDLLAVN